MLSPPCSSGVEVASFPKSCHDLPWGAASLWHAPWSKGGVLCRALAASTDLLSSKLPFPCLSCGIAQPEEIPSVPGWTCASSSVLAGGRRVAPALVLALSLSLSPSPAWGRTEGLICFLGIAFPRKHHLTCWGSCSLCV